MKLRFFLGSVLVALFLLILTTAVVAQEVPAPYAGLKNPFPWDDATAREKGRGVYQQSCLGCHGADGSNLAEADFSTADFSQRLKERADFYFWRLSEGRLDKGMPPFKSSLSEEKRWQVLTYLHSLGGVTPPAVPPPQPPAEEVKGVLQLTVPAKAQSGQPLTLTATLQDSEGKPVSQATVKFFIKVDFFTRGLMGIGEAITDDQGTAVFQYPSHQTGDIQIIARYERNGLSPTEVATTLVLAEAEETFYHPEAGIPLPAPGEEVFIGPESALDLGEMGTAPMTAFRLPAGFLSWLLLFAATVALIWFTYFRVMYQVFRIPVVSEIRDINTRLIPLVVLGIVVVLGIFLVLMIITGPYSHLQLSP